MTILSENIKKYRIAKGFTQVELAEKLGLSGNASVSDWERGIYEPNVNSLCKIADILGVDISNLLWGSKYEENS